MHAESYEDIMYTKIDQVLFSHAATVPQGIIPILLHDMYQNHMMFSVIDSIQDIGIQVIHITEG